MMKFEIYILQKKSQDPKTYQEAMGEYLKRLGAYAKVSVVYKKNVKQVEKILKEAGEHYHIIPGKDSMTSPELAQLINESSVQGISKFHFYIGDLESEETKPFHVSSFTQSGSLTGTIILEQIYRRWSLRHQQLKIKKKLTDVSWQMIQEAVITQRPILFYGVHIIR